MSTDAPSLDVVLAEVNLVRAEFGKGPLEALPRGVQKRPESCALARALDRTVGYPLPDLCPLSYWTEGLLEDPVELPGPLAEFVEAFDRGDYPDLIEEVS